MIVLNNRNVLAALCLLVLGVAAVAVGSEEEPIAKSSNLRSGKGKRELVTTIGGNFQVIKSDADPTFCMDLKDYRTAGLRHKVVMRKCNPYSWSQQWEHDSSGQIKLRLGRREMCIEAGRNAVQFQDLFIWPCNGKIHQKWILNEEDVFVNVQSELRIGTGWCKIEEGSHIQTRGISSCGVKEKFAREQPEIIGAVPTDIATPNKVAEGTISKPDVFITGETFTVTAKSVDIWGTRDAFFFASIPVPKTPAGIFSIEVKVPNGFAPTPDLHSWAKAGLMVRDTIDPLAKHFSAVITGSKGPWAMYRDTYGDETFKKNEDSAGSATGECWLRIDREGDHFAAYYRTSTPTNIKARLQYELLGEATIEMGDSVEVGIALSSHDIEKFVSVDFAVTRFAAC